MRKTKAKFQKDSPRAGFEEWNLETVEKFQTLVKDSLREAFDIAITYECFVHFEHYYGSAKDPMMLSFALPIGAVEGESPAWHVSLKDVISGLLDREFLYPIATDDKKALIRIRDGFLAMAAQIDDAIAKQG